MFILKEMTLFFKGFLIILLVSFLCYLGTLLIFYILPLGYLALKILAPINLFIAFGCGSYYITKKSSFPVTINAIVFTLFYLLLSIFFSLLWGNLDIKILCLHMAIILSASFFWGKIAELKFKFS